MRGRRNTLSSNHTTGCWRDKPCYILHLSCLNAKIRKELVENIESIWSERRVKLANCLEQKRRESED